MTIKTDDFDDIEFAPNFSPSEQYSEKQKQNFNEMYNLLGLKALAESVSDFEDKYQTGYTLYLSDSFDSADTQPATNFVLSFPLKSKLSRIPKPLKNPYNIRNSATPILDVRISTTYISMPEYQQMEYLLSEARSRGFIIRTHILTNCASLCSMIATQGTPGFRIMHENVLNCIWHSYEKQEEQKVGYAQQKKQVQNDPNQYFDLIINSWKNTYTNHTKLTDAQLKTYNKDNMAYLNASDCLKYGIVDWVLTNRGLYTKEL